MKGNADTCLVTRRAWRQRPTLWQRPEEHSLSRKVPHFVLINSMILNASLAPLTEERWSCPSYQKIQICSSSADCLSMCSHPVCLPCPGNDFLGQMTLLPPGAPYRFRLPQRTSGKSHRSSAALGPSPEEDKTKTSAPRHQHWPSPHHCGTSSGNCLSLDQPHCLSVWLLSFSAACWVKKGKQKTNGCESDTGPALTLIYVGNVFSLLTLQISISILKQLPSLSPLRG